MPKVTLRVQTAGRTHEYTYETIRPGLPLNTDSSKEKEKEKDANKQLERVQLERVKGPVGPVGPSPHCKLGRGRFPKKKTGKFARSGNKNFSLYLYHDSFMSIFP